MFVLREAISKWNISFRNTIGVQMFQAWELQSISFRKQSDFPAAYIILNFWLHQAPNFWLKHAPNFSTG